MDISQAGDPYKAKKKEKKAHAPHAHLQSCSFQLLSFLLLFSFITDPYLMYYKTSPHLCSFVALCLFLASSLCQLLATIENLEQRGYLTSTSDIKNNP